MKSGMDVGSCVRSYRCATDDGGRQRPKAQARSFWSLVGSATLLALTGCAKNPSETTNLSMDGGAQSGGAQSVGSQSNGGNTGGTSTTQSSAAASGGTVHIVGGSSSTGGSTLSSTASQGGSLGGGSPSGGGNSLGGKAVSTGGTSNTQSGAAPSGGAPPSGGVGATGGNGRGTGGGSGLAGASSAGATSTAAAGSSGNPQRLILCDEGNQRVAYVDLGNGAGGWQRPISGLRDIQLIGNNLLGVSSSTGYLELELAAGTVKKEVKGFASVQSLRRLPNGNTILGMEANGTTLQELDSKDAAVAGHKVSFPALANFRLFRRTPQGTFLVGAGNKLAEVNWNQETVWEMTFPGSNLYVYQGIKLADGKLAVSQGYGATLLLVDPATKKILTTIGGTQQPDAATIAPNFYAGFQVLPNGHFVITNWQGHGAGNGGKGIQVLEYDDTGKLIWKWKQDANLVSSLHHVIVLDGLDTTKLYDDINGVLAPATQ